MKTLSPQSLDLLQVLFSSQSGIQLPVAVAESVLEIRAWVDEQIRIQPKKPEQNNH